MCVWYENRRHHGIVFTQSQQGFDMSSAAMGSVFLVDDDPGKWFLFYTGARDNNWSKSTIGLATSSNGLDFKRNSEVPILEPSQDSFFHVQALNPAIVRVKNRFYMMFAGKHSPNSSRSIGIAYADDPHGPWREMGELIKPYDFWEGNNIDNGCSIAKIDDETLLLYYSSLTSPKAYDVFTFLRRYPIRRIGILKVRIRGASLSRIEAMRFSGNPLKHLNGLKGSWNESVFCPGYIKLNGADYLFPTGSTYSIGFPYKQYIGVTTGNSPYFPKETSQTTELIDGPAEKSQIIPNIKSEIALDTPSPYLDLEKRTLFLYYSVADRADETWKIALTTFTLH